MHFNITSVIDKCKLSLQLRNALKIKSGKGSVIVLESPCKDYTGDQSNELVIHCRPVPNCRILHLVVTSQTFEETSVFPSPNQTCHSKKDYKIYTGSAVYNPYCHCISVFVQLGNITRP